jgi:quercetin dioxygenase-like cupin family protein
LLIAELVHDETFHVTSGEVTFTSRDKEIILKTGDYIIVPPMAPHTFANKGDVTATIYNSL